MSTDRDLSREVAKLAELRDGSYDTDAIVQEIEAAFGPSSLREIPSDWLERLFQKHRTTA